MLFHATNNPYATLFRYDDLCALFPVSVNGHLIFFLLSSFLFWMYSYSDQIKLFIGRWDFLSDKDGTMKRQKKCLANQPICLFPRSARDLTSHTLDFSNTNVTGSINFSIGFVGRQPPVNIIGFVGVILALLIDFQFDQSNSQIAKINLLHS